MGDDDQSKACLRAVSSPPPSKLRARSGEIKPLADRPHVKRGVFSKPWHVEQIVNDMLRERNGMRAKEVMHQVWEETGEAASRRTIARLMSRLGWGDKAAGTESSRRNPRLNRLHARVRSFTIRGSSSSLTM